MTTNDLNVQALSTSIQENTCGIDSIDEETLKKYLFGELTWAEIVGFTAEEANAVADYGLACMASGRIDDAVTVFDGLLAFNPRDAFAHFARGTLAEQQGDDTLAVAHYCAALELEPTMVPVLLARAEILLKLGEKDAAREDLLTAAAQNPQGEDAARLAQLQTLCAE